STGESQKCVNNTCVVDCNGSGDDEADDAICDGVSDVLTCSESAGHICVKHCVGNGSCDAGYSCLGAGDENACLPTGSFPGSPCAAGNTCAGLGGGVNQV